MLTLTDNRSSTPASGDALSGAQSYMFALLALVYACHLIDRTIILVLLEPIKHEFGLSDTQLGLLSGFIFALGTLVAALPIGALADRRSRKLLLAGCIAVWSGMTLLCGLASGFASLLLLRFGVGAAEAGLQPTALSLVGDATTLQQRPRAIAIVHIGIPLGILIGFVLGGWAAAHLGWRTALMLVGVPGLVLAGIVAATLREPTRQVAGRGPSEAGNSLGAFFVILWQNKSLLHVVFGLVLLWLCTSSSSAWLSPFFIRTHDLSIATVGLIMAGTAGFGGLIGNLISGTAIQSFAHGRPDRLALAATLAAIAYFPLSLVTFLSPNLALAIATLFTQSAFYFMIFTPGYALAMDLADAAIRARTAALISMGATALGYGLGPQIVGILSDLLAPSFGQLSLRYALLAMMLVMLWAGTHFFTAYTRLRREPQPG